VEGELEVFAAEARAAASGSGTAALASGLVFAPGTSGAIESKVEVRAAGNGTVGGELEVAPGAVAVEGALEVVAVDARPSGCSAV
jgi:hypothetical protein